MFPRVQAFIYEMNKFFYSVVTIVNNNVCLESAKIVNCKCSQYTHAHARTHTHTHKGITVRSENVD